MKKIFFFLLLLPILGHAQFTNSGSGTWFNTPDKFKWQTQFGKNGTRNWYQAYQVDSAEINNSNVGQIATFNVIGSPIVQQNGLGTTTVPGFSILNNTPSTSMSTINVSPALSLVGSFYNGTSVSDAWWMWVTPSSSGGILNLGPSLNGAQAPSTITISGSGTIVGSSLQFGRALFSGSSDAASGVGQIVNSTADVGATADNNDLAGIRLNNTFSTTTGLGTVKNIAGGTGGTNGTYTNVLMLDNNLPSKSTSAIATATVVVSGGAVVSVTPGPLFGGRYTVNDVLTAPSSSIGGVTGFTCQVNTTHTYSNVGTAQIEVGFGGIRWIPILFANAPANPPEGQAVWFSDSSTGTYGATITGGGTHHVLGIFDGTNWVAH